MKETVFGEEKQLAYYALAYAYYLKAFAECTFLAARKQGITLREDFDDEEDGQVYDLAYFQRKSAASLDKALTACLQARDWDGDLRMAIDFLKTQTI